MELFIFVAIFVALPSFIGIIFALKRVSTIWRVLAGIVLVLFQNLLWAWPYFDKDPETWFFTYATGLVYYCVMHLLFAIVPFLAAYFVTTACMDKSKRRKNEKHEKN